MNKLGLQLALAVLVFGAIALVGAIAYPLAGILSDRWGDRCALVALGCALGAVSCIGIALLPSSALRVIPLTCLTLCSPLVMTSFWCLPTQFLKGPSAAAGIALINSIGQCGGFFGPSILGIVKQVTGSDSGGLFALAAVGLAGSFICLALRGVAVFRQRMVVPATT